MDNATVIQRVRKYRADAAKDARDIAAELGLTAEERSNFFFSADSNAIWDAQEGRAYRKPVYTPPPPPMIVPMYDELGFLSDEEYKRIMGKERKK
jgi:hypothetical protein